MRHTLTFTMVSIALAFPIGEGGSAYAQKIVHDKQKEKQWRSMETGPWDFAPDWYYYLFHNDYSGAYLKWEWHGFKSGYRVHFDEKRSHSKTVMPRRVAAELEQKKKLEKVEEERQQIKPLYEEELEREADRTVDLVYNTYKDDFNRMQDTIGEGLSYCLTKSKGKLAPQVTELTRQNEILTSNIAYIHKTGYKQGLENAKREKAYAQYKKDMEQLVSRVAHLVGMAQTHY